MKRILCVLLSLLLLLPCLALADEWLCPSCGRTWGENDLFCGGCGTPRMGAEIKLEENGPDYLQISWSGFTDAVEYWIYTGNAADDSWHFVAKTSRTRYLFTDLASGVTFDVRVRSDGGETAVLEGASAADAAVPTASPAASTATPAARPAIAFHTNPEATEPAWAITPEKLTCSVWSRRGNADDFLTDYGDSVSVSVASGDIQITYRVFLTNDSDVPQQANAGFLLDGERMLYRDYVLQPGETLDWRLSAESAAQYMTVGTHTLDVYYNDVYITTFTFTVTE